MKLPRDMYVEWREGAKVWTLEQINIKRIKICCFPCYVSNYIFQMARRMGALNLIWETLQEFCENQWKQPVSLCGVQQWHNFEKFFVAIQSKGQLNYWLFLVLKVYLLLNPNSELMQLTECSYELYSQEYNNLIYGEYLAGFSTVSREIRLCLCCSFVFILCSI